LALVDRDLTQNTWHCAVCAAALGAQYQRLHSRATLQRALLVTVTENLETEPRDGTMWLSRTWLSALRKHCSALDRALQAPSSHSNSNSSSSSGSTHGGPGRTGRKPQSRPEATSLIDSYFESKPTDQHRQDLGEVTVAVDVDGLDTNANTNANSLPAAAVGLAVAVNENLRCQHGALLPAVKKRALVLPEWAWEVVRDAYPKAIAFAATCPPCLLCQQADQVMAPTRTISLKVVFLPSLLFSSLVLSSLVFSSFVFSSLLFSLCLETYLYAWLHEARPKHRSQFG
jgi:hypothetical protein